MFYSYKFTDAIIYNILGSILSISMYIGNNSVHQYDVKKLKEQSNLPSASIVRKSEGWLLISEPGTTPVIYYAPLSIQTDQDGFASVTSLINYISDEGNEESLLGVSLYNCAELTKQEQSTVQYSKHWADGDVLFEIGLEEPWNSVKAGTEGMLLLKVACYR
jgi:hypothetical protein